MFVEKNLLMDQQIKNWDIYDLKGIGVGGYTRSELLGDTLNKIPSFSKVLEIGCGRGNFLINKIPTNFIKFGLDYSEKAIEQARLKAATIDFMVGDATKLPYNDRLFQFVYSIEVIEHVKDGKSFISEIDRVLDINGYVFLQTPNYPIKRLYDVFNYMFRKKDTYRDDYTHVNKFTFSRLENELSKKFEIIGVYPRNIFFETKLKFFRKLKEHNNLLAKMLSQKTIVIAKKKL